MKQSHKSVLKDKVAMDILGVLEESDLSLNVIHEKVAPQKAKTYIYQKCQKLLREGLVTNSGHTRSERLRPGRPPLILQIAEHGRRLLRPTRFQKAPLAPDELAKSIVSFPTQVTTELSRLFMEIAVILEKAA